jgi:hypothetical protein
VDGDICGAAAGKNTFMRIKIAPFVAIGSHPELARLEAGAVIQRHDKALDNSVGETLDRLDTSHKRLASAAMNISG